MSDSPLVHWREEGRACSARWRSERGAAAPAKVVLADDRMRADEAYGLAAQGTGLLWRGDFQNARHMLTAMGHRADKKSPSPLGEGRGEGESLLNVFNHERRSRAQRARTLGMLLIPVEADFSIALRRAPDVREACIEAWGPPAGEASVVSLRELLGVIGAHEWRRNGIDLPAAGLRIHPHYGVFAPIRSEYVDLVAKAPLPAASASPRIAFDIGTGTGVIAAVLAKRGIERVVATDNDPRALACARENVERLGLASQVDVIAADLFPEGRAALVVCNPPWLPARPSSPLERALYDPGSAMLRGFLHGLPAHLEPGGEGWLILSDLAEHLGLRGRGEVLALIEQAGLKVRDRIDARPRHARASDANDALFAARKAEVTSLWRLAP